MARRGFFQVQTVETIEAPGLAKGAPPAAAKSLRVSGLEAMGLVEKKPQAGPPSPGELSQNPAIKVLDRSASRGNRCRS